MPVLAASTFAWTRKSQACQSCFLILKSLKISQIYHIVGCQHVCLDQEHFKHVSHASLASSHPKPPNSGTQLAIAHATRSLTVSSPNCGIMLRCWRKFSPRKGSGPSVALFNAGASWYGSVSHTSRLSGLQHCCARAPFPAQIGALHSGTGACSCPGRGLGPAWLSSG